MPSHDALLTRIALAAAFAVSGIPAHAQEIHTCNAPPGTVSPGSVDVQRCEQRGQELFELYRNRYRGTGDSGAEALMKVEAYGRLAKTPQNIAALRSLAASPLPLVERIQLARMLGRQCASRDGPNRLILADLKQLTTAPDRELALTATFSYSRCGYSPDSEAVLQAAKDRRLLDDDAYYGEIAHMLPSATGADQARLVKTLRVGGNRYVTDIALNAFNSAGERFGHAARAELRPLVESMEPRLTVTASLYGEPDASRYADWLTALATLKHPDSPGDAAEFIIATIDTPLQDPRKVIAMLTTPVGQRFVATIGVRSRFDRLLGIVAIYPKQYPGNAAALQMEVANAYESVQRNTR